MASVNELVAAVKAKAAARAADLTAEWWATVKAAATGGRVSAEKVAALLDRLGKSADEFERAVTLHAERLAHRDQIAAADEWQKRAAAARAKLAQLNAEFEAFEKKHYEATEPLSAEIEYAKEQSRLAGFARERLFDDCPYPHLRERLDALKRELARVEPRIKAAKELVERYSFVRVESADYIKRQYSPEEIETAERRLPQVEADLAAARAEKDRIAAEQDKVVEEMRVP